MAESERLSYAQAGVDIAATDAAKASMAASLETNDRRVLNRIGAFATLFDGRFPGHTDPVLVLKTEEPGSKQKLAFAHDRIEGDRKSTRLNSSHANISYAVFCLKKKKNTTHIIMH